MAKHARPDDMQYIGDFPKGQTIVLVYPTFGDIVRWVPVKDEYGFDQHDAEILARIEKGQVVLLDQWGDRQTKDDGAFCRCDANYGCAYCYN